MISHKHKCIFVHVPKVAGISIEQIFLEELELDSDNRAALLMGVNTNKDFGPPRVSHLTASEYIDLHYISSELYQKYFSFGWVRNPYNRVYSFYKYLGYNNLISFKKFVDCYLEKLMNDKKLYYFVQPMYNYLYVNDKLAVNYVGKLESINEDMNTVFQNVSIKNREIPHMNNSEKISLLIKIKRYSRIIKRSPNILLNISFSKKKKEKIFDQEMKNNIIEIYKKDFISFDYKY